MFGTVISDVDFRIVPRTVWISKLKEIARLTEELRMTNLQLLEAKLKLRSRRKRDRSR